VRWILNCAYKRECGQHADARHAHEQPAGGVRLHQCADRLVENSNLLVQLPPGNGTYNLYMGFRGIALCEGWERSQVQIVRWRLFQTAGAIVRHGRQVFLKISAAMLDMCSAIRERCARFMQEEGAVPETS
jgi:hypothetical protein